MVIDPQGIVDGYAIVWDACSLGLHRRDFHSLSPKLCNVKVCTSMMSCEITFSIHSMMAPPSNTALLWQVGFSLQVSP